MPKGGMGPGLTLVLWQGHELAELLFVVGLCHDGDREDIGYRI